MKHKIPKKFQPKSKQIDKENKKFNIKTFKKRKRLDLKNFKKKKSKRIISTKF